MASETNKEQPGTTDVRAVMDAAKFASRQYVHETSKEILDWHNTGLLANGRLREIASMLAPLSAWDALSIAEKLAIDAALEVAAHVR